MFICSCTLYGSAWACSVSYVFSSCVVGSGGVESELFVCLAAVWSDLVAWKVSCLCVWQLCGRIWSPQSVESELQTHCLPFLRIAAHMRQHLFNAPLPQTTALVSTQSPVLSLVSTQSPVLSLVSTQSPVLALVSTQAPVLSLVSSHSPVPYFYCFCLLATVPYVCYILYKTVK